MGGVRTAVWVGIQASRPSHLLLICGVYLLGAAIAVANGTPAATTPLVTGLLALILCSMSIHFANEYADYETDSLTERTPFSGGSGALPGATVSRQFVLWLGIGSLAAGGLVTGVLAIGGILPSPAVLLLVGATILGWQYSVGPLRLAWRGLGEVTNATLGGLALPVYGAAVIGGDLGVVALAAIPFALLVLLNLFATQWPDRKADAAVGKDTLAVRWSAGRLRLAYAGIAVAAGITLLALYGRVLPPTVVFGSLLIGPLVIWGWAGYTKRHVPWPTVSAMVGFAVVQFLGWLWVIQA